LGVDLEGSDLSGGNDGNGFVSSGSGQNVGFSGGSSGGRGNWNDSGF